MTVSRSIRKLTSGTARYGIFRSICGIARLLKFKILKPQMGTISTTTDGIILNFQYPGQFMPTLAVFQELVEPEYEYLRKVLSNDSVFFDVGGGIGTYSTFAAKMIDGPIHTFEPVTENIQTIERNLRANHLEGKVRLNPVVLSNQEGFCQMEKRANLFGSSIGDVSTAGHTDAVKVTTLDAYCSEHSIKHIDVIKIDTEGHEQQILEGARNMLMNEAIGVIILETDHRLARFYSSMKDAGFEIFYYDYRTSALKSIFPLSADTIKNAEPSGFSSNIVLVHRGMLQKHSSRFTVQ